MSRDFVWRDAGRTVVFGEGGVEGALATLGEHGWAGYRLLSTARALTAAPALAAAASDVREVGPGQVPELAAELLAAADLGPGRRDKGPPQGAVGAGIGLVAFGGGRVIDVAKALAAVTGAEVAAIPTTLSGAEMTAIHRLPAGAEDRAPALVRPRLVIADPAVMTGLAEPRLRASAMNALAHGADSLYTPLANPVSESCALRGAALITAALEAGDVSESWGRIRIESSDTPFGRASGLAFGSILCGYALDSAGFGLHHVVCQSLVRACGTPHAETNAAILPHAVALLASRAPDAFAPLAAALATDLDGLVRRLAELGRPQPLRSLATDPDQLDEAVAAMIARPQLASVPGPALTSSDLAAVVTAAW